MGSIDLPPVYDMPPTYDHSITERPVEKESTLKSFLKSCLELIKDETALNMLCGMIDQCAQDKEAHVAHEQLTRYNARKG
jgi:hypothetical protein